MTLFYRLTYAALALGILVACQSPPPTPDYGDPGILFKDDFSNPNSGWDAYTGADVTTNYEDGRYVIVVDKANQEAVWGTPGLEMLTDVVIDVDTAYGDGPENNIFGVMCRYTRGGDGKESFYFLRISSDGYFSLGKVARNQVKVFVPEQGEYQASDVIRLKGENHLTATCSGAKISLAVNGTVVGAFEDDEFTQGDMGLTVGTFDEGGAKIYFDNVVVRRP